MTRPRAFVAPQRISVSGRCRLDKELCRLLGISREICKRLILSGRIKISGETRHHPAKRLGEKMEIEILPEPEKEKAARANFSGYDIKIIYEDGEIVAVDKPVGLAVHPGAGHENDTLVDWLRSRKIKLARTSDPSRAGLVHRLDKDTSGIILIAKESAAAEHLMSQFAERKVEKEYRAVVQGRLPAKPLRIVGAIGRSPDDRKKFSIQSGGRDAVTVVESIAESSTTNACLIRAIPKTGRTHQIRVHLKHAGFPIIGDPVYGRKNLHGVGRMLLHAYLLSFTHPGNNRPVKLVAPLPADFVEPMNALGIMLNMTAAS